VAGQAGRRGWRAGLTALWAVTPVGGLVACSDGDGSGGGIEGAALVEPFGELAEELHEGGDPSLGDVPGENVRLLTCPVLTDDDAVAIAGALGLDDPDRATAEGVKILDGSRAESVQCSIDGGDTEEWVDVWTGTTTETADDPEERVDEGAEVIDGEAPGLDDADVFGVDGPQGPMSVIWRDEGFYVSLSLPEGYDDADRAFRALALTAETVAESLD
jgi:hypothetical protein